MDSLERASTASITETHGIDQTRGLPKEQSSRPTRRKRRMFPETALRNLPTAGLSEDSFQSSRKHVPKKQTQTFVELQKSYIQDQIESATVRPKLDDIRRYGVSAFQEARLWELETERLATAIQSDITQNPLTSAAPEEWRPDDAGFEILSTVAREVIQNITVCDFDNNLVLFECQHELFDNYRLQHARNVILSGRQTGASDNKVAETTETEVAISGEQTRKFYCALIDYVTTVAARCISNNIPDGVWHAFCMTSLARLAAKLKFLAIDSEGFASQSLDNGQNAVARGSLCDDKFDTCNSGQTFAASSWAMDSLLSIFSGLEIENKSGSPKNTIHMGIIVYKPGWKDVPMVLSQNQRGEISGIRMQSAKWSIYGALEILTQMIYTVKFRAAKLSSVPVSIALDYHDSLSEPSDTADGNLRWRKLETLAEVVSFMVPLLFMQPERLLQLDRPPSFVTEDLFDSGDFKLRIGEEAKFPAFAELRVNIRGIPLRGPFVNINRRLRKKSKFRPQQILTLLQPSVLQPFGAAMEIQRGSAQDWAIEEKSIVVRRRLYVIMTLTSCGTLVIGGILAGLLVGERIPGVDPFNIATFTWVLAAFIILIAKSLSVRQWPWRDFLRGQVPCGSVSELQTVTGIDEQDILIYLLANDVYTVLTTRGPFNLFFKRRSDDGFSIDIKMDIRTLLASGIAVVQVATHTGLALVCLDLRRGVDGRKSIHHFDGPQEGEHLLGCFDSSEDIYGSQDVHLHTLSQSMTWTRILGLYDGVHESVFGMKDQKFG